MTDGATPNGADQDQDHDQGGGGDGAGEGDLQTVDAKLLELLVCPQTKGPLVYDQTTNELVSKKARLAYPIRDGIPIMLVDEARALTDAEATALGA